MFFGKILLFSGRSSHVISDRAEQFLDDLVQ